MKFCNITLLYFILFLIHINNAYGQATGFNNTAISYRNAIQINLERDFGADPTGKKNSTWAFIKAARYIQNLWDKKGIPLINGRININYSAQYIVLNIPWGNYVVGKQIDLKTFEKGAYYLYNNAKNTSSGKITIPYNKIFFGIAPSQNKQGISIYPTQYKNAYYTPRYICTDIFSVNNNRSNFLNGIIIQDTSNGKSKGSVNIKCDNDMRIGFIDSLGTNSKKIPPFGDIRQIQASFLSSSGPTVINFGYPFEGADGVNAWSDSAIINVKIQGININGNSVNYYFGGRILTQDSKDVYLHPQLGTYGIKLQSTKNITLQNCNIIQMGTDGIYLNDAAYKSPTNIVIKNVTSDYNARQGISVCGVNGLLIDSCNFRYTGKLKTNKSHGNAKLWALPAAGMDIEPEAGMDIYNSYANSVQGCFNATVSNSTFQCNSGFNVCQTSFNSFTYGDGSIRNYYAKNWNFINCLFENDSMEIFRNEPQNAYQGVVIGQPFFKFSKCIFNDVFTTSLNSYQLTGGETVFDRCTFYDKILRGGHTKKGTQPIIGSEYVSRLKFNNCTFNIQDSVWLSKVKSLIKH